MQPGIEPTTADLKNSAHRYDAILVPMVIDKSVLYSGSFAKYRAAFFRMSRSSSVRLS